MQLTVREALALQPLHSAVVIGGAQALDQRISWVHEVDVMRDQFMLPPGSLLVSSGRGLDDPLAAGRFLRAASLVGCRGLVIAMNDGVVPELPLLASLADEFGLPVVTATHDLAFGRILPDVARALLAPEDPSPGGLFARLEEVSSEEGYGEHAALIGRSLGASVLILNRGRQAVGSFQADGGSDRGDYLDLLARTAALERVFRSRDLVTISPGPDTDSPPLVVVPVVFDEGIHGAVAVVTSSAVDKALTASLDQAARAVALQFYRTRLEYERDQGRMAELAHSLLSEAPGLEIAVRRRLQGIGFDLDRPWRVVLMRPSGGDSADEAARVERMADAARHMLRDEHYTPLVVAYQGGVTIIKEAHADGTGREVEGLSRLHQELAGRDPAVRLWVAAGGPVEIGDAATSLQQAEYALKAAQARGDNGSVLAFEDLGIDRLLIDLIRSPRATAWVLDVLQPVLAYDRRKKGPLLQRTLETYLALDCNADRTAEKLYLHPNTVRYRLRVVEELTGRRLSAQEHRTAFHVALRLLSLMPGVPETDEQETFGSGLPA